MGSLTEPSRGQFRCPRCGRDVEEMFRLRPAVLRHSEEKSGICARCFAAGRQDKPYIIANNLHRCSPAESNDELFAGLFKAARLLLQEGEDEDRIVPTLMLAHKSAWRVQGLFYANVSMVDVVNGVPILQQSRIIVRGYEEKWSAGVSPQKRIPESICITLLPHWRPITAEEIILAYEMDVRRGHGDWDSREGRVWYRVSEDPLQYIDLYVERINPDIPDNLRILDWPSSNIVGAVAKAALNEYSGGLGLQARERGGPMEAETLVPAMVALLLSNNITKEEGHVNRAEIHRLLNEYVFCEIPWKRLPASGVGTNLSRQLWRDVDKMKERLYGPQATQNWSHLPKGVKKKAGEMHGPGPLIIWREGPLTVAGPFPDDVFSEVGSVTMRIIATY